MSGNRFLIYQLVQTFSFLSFSVTIQQTWINRINFVVNGICRLGPAEWFLWFLSKPAQVAVLLLSILLSIDILDNGTADVYAKMVRFKERAPF